MLFRSPPLAVSLLLQMCVVLFAALLIVLYIRLVTHFQQLNEKLDLWINTAAIFFCHLQTVSIIGTLKLAWPPTVEEITQFAGLDFIALGALRPECTLQLGDGFFYYYQIFRLVLLLVLVLRKAGGVPRLLGVAMTISYASFLAVLRDEHAERLEELPAILAEIRACEGQPYAATFLLDHDDPVFGPALLASAEQALLRHARRPGLPRPVLRG